MQSDVKGTNRSKKWMRNEIWSLVNHCGAPFWYITLSPGDLKNPICLYYAGSSEEFQPGLKSHDERMKLICSNPVACSQFFDFVVKTFIKYVLGVKSPDDGLYGKVSAYYGTVEQQGRLSLHLHMILWLEGNLIPNEIRKRILDNESDCQTKHIAWVESCQIGEYLTGTQEEILEKVSSKAHLPSYEDPTETLPCPPPVECNIDHLASDDCRNCSEVKKWWIQFDDTVDDLISKVNIHNCD